ncbi:MAG: hypothetical protein DMG00_27695 [Acidobacteria bacterium]|nr:MAG: hypothetical protein DMG00_27695 [Acidobacteriota bacterium]
MRFQCALPLACTVGSRFASRNRLRPAVGIDSSAFESMMLPVDAFVLSMNGDSPTTVIVSSIVPISSLRSSARNCCVLMRTPVRSNVR